jgi:hypothetical protein
LWEVDSAPGYAITIEGFTMNKPKIFISWAGTRGLAVAEALRDWLPDVIQSVDLFLSAQDVDKGKRWRDSISGALTATDFGVICLTPENLDSRWLLFEAGALSKNAEGRVWTYLLDLELSVVPDPLAQFQHTAASKEDTRKMLHAINRTLADHARESGKLDRLFDVMWPQLEAKLNQAKAIPVLKPQSPNVGTLLRDILTRVCDIQKNVALRPKSDQSASGDLARPTSLDAYRHMRWKADLIDQLLSEESDQGALVPAQRGTKRQKLEKAVTNIRRAMHHERRRDYKKALAYFMDGDYAYMRALGAPGHPLTDPHQDT